ncbi:ESPR-type extended signal peptide-containing protein [Acidaminococcus sp. LBK-2]|uniref:ESPR-type extended signal peptide-containing protein n=1 Tax=Acidaminococcus sp. LBK-2 TaxID=3456956 RepID=UPI003FA430B3
MNKIYKVIWSKVKKCYVVVSEIARNHGKEHSSRNSVPKEVYSLTLALGLAFSSAPLAAAAPASNTGNASANQAVNIENKTETTAQGSDAYATYDSQGNLIVGKDNQVSPIQKDPKTGNARSDKQAENVALGTRNGIGKFTHSTETKKPISGDESYAYEKLDTEWITVKVYNPDTNTYDDKQVEVYKLTPGQYMDDEYNVRAKYPERSYYSTDEDYRKAVEVYNNVATYYSQDRTRQSYYTSGATAVGVDNVAEGDRSTAIGNKAKVLNSVSSYYVDRYGKLTSDKDSAGYWLDDQGNITNSRQGYYASDGTFVDRYYMVPRLIDSTDAVAVGSDVTAEGRSAVAIGHESYAKEYSVAIGENSVTDYMGVAIGKDNKAKYASTAIGHDNSADGYYTATMGVRNTARADESTAIGYNNNVNGQQQNGGTTPKATYTHVLGSNNTVKGSYNAVFGDTNTVTGAYALALGGHNKISRENTNDADGDYGIAIGYGNTAENNALALGLNSNALHDGSIAIGKSVNTTGDNNNQATDSIAIGTKAAVHMKNGIALGEEAYAGNNGDDSEGAISIGHQAKSAAGESIAIGTKATTGNNNGSTGMKNIGAIAIGSNTNADTVYDIAMGVGASTTNTVNGGAIALGHNATIEQGGQASAAIGDSARVKMNLHDAVALGSQAYADREANNQGGYDPASNNKNHNAGSGPVWNSTLAAVSVGSSEQDVWDGSKNVHYAQQTRQITNVAAGKEDTDAVNVAQLKQVVNLVNNGGGSGTGGSGVHDYSVNSVDSTTDSNYNNAGATGSNALAAGVNASATGENAVAIGTGAKADGTGATVIGQYGTASGRYALAFGGQQTDNTAPAANNQAIGDNSVAFGERSKASGSNATAFGQGTQATEKRATAFGQRTQATQSNATAFGIDTLASGQNATAFGNLTQATAIGATAFGNKNQATGLYATAWGGGDKKVDNGDGTTKKVGTVASGTYATAFGERTEASGESATAFGSDSTASGKNALAFGENSTAEGENSLAALGGTVAKNATNAAAIGKDSQAKLADTVALGSGSVADRQSDVKGYDAATGAETTQTSAAWVSNANAIAVGNGSTLTRQITGVAAGSQDTDAVNLAQLKEVGKLAGKHTTVSVGGNKATADDTLVKGGNLELKRHTTDGQANYDVALSKDVVLGEQEEHKGGSLVVNSVAQFRTAPGSKETYPVKEAVKIDGTTVSVVKNDGTNDQRQVVLGIGQDTGGYVALYDNTGKTPTYIFNAISSGITYLKDSKTYPANEANEFKRLEYGDITNGSTQFIATLDDGLKFSGDQGTASAVKLNQKLSITGGETNKDNLATANNIGVVSSQDKDNGKLELKLNKDLTGLNTVTAGTAKIGHYADGVLDAVQNGQPTGGHAKGGEFVTGLTNKEWTVESPTYVSGRAATEDELRIVSDAVSGNTTNITNNTTQITNNTNTIAKGLSFTTNTKDASNTSENYKGYKVVKRSLGDTIAIKASDETDGHSYSTANLTTRIAENGDISILMDEKPSFTTVTTGDVIYTGNPDGKDKDGKAAQADTSVHYGDKTLKDGKNITTSDNETKSTRLGYQDAQGLRHDIATMDDGQIYAGDITSDGKLDEKGFARTMNQKTTINGGVKETGKLTDGNIGVVSNGTDTLTVKLAKELKDLTSVTTGNTKLEGKGLTITNTTDETKNVVINGDKISFGGNQVNNMGSGIDTATNQYDTLTNGANIGDVKNIASSTVQPVIDTVNKGWELEVDGTKRKDVTPTSRVVNLAAGQNIQLGGTGDTVTIATADDVRFNTVRVGGSKTGDTYDGGIVIGKQSGKNADGSASANPDDNYYITGLQNTNWDASKIMKGRAATEDQLQAVVDEIKNGTVKGDVFVTGGSVKYNGEGTGTNDGTGKLYLTEQNKTDPLEITGLHDYYATGGSVTADGKTLEITRNDRDGKGNPQKISIDLSNVLKNDLRLVQNPAAGTNGKYTVAQDGTVTLKVQNADGTVSNDITIGGFEGVAKGLDFDANTRTTTDGKVHNVKMGGTIKVQGIDPVSGHTYSADNVTTEVDDSGNITIKLDKDLTANTVTVGQAGKAGENGAAGSIGINGKDGKDGITTTLIRTEKGQPGKDGTNGKPGVDGTDITRIVYQNGQDGTDGKDIHTVATLEDGLKFAGDDGQNDTTKVISKKLNEQLDIIGGAALDSLTDNNIGVKNKDGKLYVRLAKHVELDKDGSLKAGNLTIGAFSNTELTTNKNNHPSAGSYATGLSNKDWNVVDPEYVSGRAATEDQLAKLSQTITDSNTVRTDYQLVQNPNTDDGSYTATNGELTLTVRDMEHKDDPKYPDKTITIKDIASKTKVDEAYDRTVKYDMKEGKVDKTRVTFEAVDEAGNPMDTQVSHMASGASEIKVDEKGRPISYVYDIDNNGANIGDVKNIAKSLDEEVTKRGLDFRGNDGKTVHRDLGTLLNLTGGLKDQDELAQATGKNLGVRQNGDQDGLEIVMTDTPDFAKVTVGKDASKKITIGEQPNGKHTSETGNYITGLDNTQWDKNNIVENRAATEGQLSQAIGEIKGAEKGGFGLADETGNTVKQDLGGTIAVKGDGKNIETKVNGDALEVSLKKDVELGKEGSLKAGNTTINSEGVETNKVKVGDITITKDGINGGTKQITHIGSGIDGKQYATAGDNNAASIGDVKKIAGDEAGKAAEAVKSKSGKNITVKDDHTVNLNDNITLGDDQDKAKQVAIDGNGAKVTAGDGANKVTVDGSKGQVTIGSGNKTLTLGQQANTAGDSNPVEGNYLNGLDNTQWDGEHIQKGRAATEDQLKIVSDKVNSGRKFQGDDGKEVKVGMGDTLNIKGGATDVSDANNIGIVRGDDNTLNVRLAKDLTGLTSVTTGNTTINNGGLTVKAGDSSQQDITIQQGSVSMGGNRIHNVAPGTAPTDAVNVSQLQQTGRAINQLGSSLDKLGSRVDRVGANSAALAALHPLDFDPDDKLDFAVGAGNYSGANAVALGAFYRPNEDVMFSIGGSTGGGENMINVGATFKIGQHNHVSNSRVAMAKEIRDLKALVARQDGEMQQMKTLMNQLSRKTVMAVDKDALFPDIPENHWAYDYVMKLARAGIIEGYEDGQFKGDRMMTRYEFAALLYRAIMGGAASNPDLNQDGTLGKLVKEFDGELKYIRIDVIEKDKHGKPTIERVRTVEDSKKHHGK